MIAERTQTTQTAPSRKRKVGDHMPSAKKKKPTPVPSPLPSPVPVAPTRPGEAKSAIPLDLLFPLRRQPSEQSPVKEPPPPLRELKVERSMRGFSRSGGRDNIVAVSPDTLSSMRVPCGSWIVLSTLPETGSSSTVAQVWPYASVPSGHVRVQIFGDRSFSPSPGVLVKVYPVASPLSDATAVDFQVDGSVPSAITDTFVRQSLVGRAVMPGMEAGVDVLDKSYHMTAHLVEPRPAMEPSDPSLTVRRISSSTRLSFKSRRLASGVSDGSSKEEEKEQATTADEAKGDRVTFDEIGGLEKEITALRELVELPLLRPELFLNLGLKPPRGVLLYGPPGTGKTMIARAVAHEVKGSFLIVNGPELISKYVGESEQRLRELFAKAQQAAPAVIFIDEIDAIAPKRDEVTDELQKRVVATLLTLMDGVEERERLVVLAATNRPHAIDPALRRPGRFDREIEIGIPTESGRLSILTRIFHKMPHSITPEQFASAASTTHGFVGADLKALARESGLTALKRLRAFSEETTMLATTIAIAQTTETKAASASVEADGVVIAATATIATTIATTDEPAAAPAAESASSEKRLQVEYGDLISALGRIKPSGMREVQVEVPKVRWDDIGGQHEIKQKLQEAVEWPLKDPASFLRLGIEPPKGILLYGPPGCSKTLMAKALANESSRNFLAVKGPELFSKWVGDSEKAIKEVFKKARANAPAIIFFDEIDSIAVQRSGGGDGADRVAERVLSQLLIELDGIESLKRVTVIAATNRPDVIDKALLRPGRIDRILYVGPPDELACEEIFRIELRRMAHNADDESIRELGQLAHKRGLSGAEITAVCREAAMLAMEEDIDAQQVDKRHFKTCVDRFKPRITSEMLQFYRNYEKNSRVPSI